MKKSRLILALYFGVIAMAVASVSMSVAWFVANRTLYVSSINITIDTDRDLKISQSRDEDYVEHIDHSDKDITEDFMPLTSAHSSLWTSERKDSPIFYDESGCSDIEDYVSYKVAKENSGYFSRKYYLLADDNVYVKVNPDKDKTYITKNEESNSEFANELASEFKVLKAAYDKAKNESEADPTNEDLAKEFTIANNHLKAKMDLARYITEEELDLEETKLAEIILDRLNRVVNAMRFSILIKDGDEYSYTIIDPNKEGETLLGGVLDNAVDNYYDTYLKTGTDDWYERIYGEYTGEPVYEDADVADPDEYFDSKSPKSAFNAHHKPGVKTYSKTKSEANNFVIATEQSLGREDFSSYHFPVYMDTPKEIIVSIYLEGWDSDSVNYTMKAAFNASLSFMIEREM